MEKYKNTEGVYFGRYKTKEMFGETKRKDKGQKRAKILRGYISIETKRQRFREIKNDGKKVKNDKKKPNLMQKKEKKNTSSNKQACS